MVSFVLLELQRTRETIKRPLKAENRRQGPHLASVYSGMLAFPLTSAFKYVTIILKFMNVQE